MKNAFITGIFAVIAAVAGALIGRQSATNLTFNVEGTDQKVSVESVQETIDDLEERLKRLEDENSNLKERLEEKKSQPKPDLKPKSKPNFQEGEKSFKVGSISVTFNNCVSARDGRTRCDYSILNSDIDQNLSFANGKLVDNFGNYHYASWHSISGKTRQVIHKDVPTRGYFIFPPMAMKSEMASVITGTATVSGVNGGRGPTKSFKVTNVKIHHEQ